MDTMESYRRAQDLFDAVVAAVPADAWERRSACTKWTVRDVAGHVTWAQRQLRAWATGVEYTEQGGPGSAHPAEVLAGADPVAAWREARAAAQATLTPETLARIMSLPGLGDVPLSAIVTLLTTDTLAHAWDVGHPLGIAVRFDAGLIPGSFAWSRTHAVRQPAFFGPELTPPAGADEQTKLLAFLGRAAWQPVPA